MGNPVSKIRNEIKEDKLEKKHEMEQRLHILEKMVDSRLQNQMIQIIAGERGDEEIHAGTVVELHRQVNIKETEKDSQELSGAIDDFFGADLQGGFEHIIKTTFDTVLGNESMGEYESTDMFIVWSSNSLLRCDAYYYRWNFVSKGVIDQAEGVVGILLVKRVIDITKTDPQVLTWAVSSQAHRQNKTPSDTSKMIDSAMTVLDKVVRFQANLKKIEKDPQADV